MCWPPSSSATSLGPRLAEAITPRFRAQGFHGCLVAIFAGAVATGRLLGLDAAHMAQAIALSATSMGGLAAAANTSVAREYHAGLAAMLGIRAALAAQKGYVAEESILETRQGFFEVYGGADGVGILRDLGQVGYRHGHGYQARAWRASQSCARRSRRQCGQSRQYRSR